MTCLCCGFDAAVERQFGVRHAARELRRYRTRGPSPTTRLLRSSLASTGVLQGSLLDIGAGIGALTFALLDDGLTDAIAVDASAAYLAAAAEEAARRGRNQVIRLVHGDFVDLAPELPVAPVVTLDRVVCCYPAWTPLLAEVLRHTGRLLALSYPRDVWYVRAGMGLENGTRRLARNPFRTFVHPAAAMRDMIEVSGFTLLSRQITWTWAVDVYARGAR